MNGDSNSIVISSPEDGYWDFFNHHDQNRNNNPTTTGNNVQHHFGGSNDDVSIQRNPTDMGIVLPCIVIMLIVMMIIIAFVRSTFNQYQQRRQGGAHQQQQGQSEAASNEATTLGLDPTELRTQVVKALFDEREIKKKDENDDSDSTASTAAFDSDNASEKDDNDGEQDNDDHDDPFDTIHSSNSAICCSICLEELVPVRDPVDVDEVCDLSRQQDDDDDFDIEKGVHRHDESSFQKEDLVAATTQNPCGHSFHRDCLLEWTTPPSGRTKITRARRDECPMCRQPMWDEDTYQRVEKQVIARYKLERSTSSTNSKKVTDGNEDSSMNASDAAPFVTLTDSTSIEDGVIRTSLTEDDDEEEANTEDSFTTLEEQQEESAVPPAQMMVSQSADEMAAVGDIP